MRSKPTVALCAALVALGLVGPLSAQPPRQRRLETFSQIRAHLRTGSFQNVRTACPDGSCDYTTIGAALSFVSGKARSIDAQWIVEVMPAVYTITAQLSVPDHTKLACKGNYGRYYGACRIAANAIAAGSAIKLNAPYSSVVGFQIYHQPTTLTAATYTIEADGVGSTMAQDLFIWSQANTTTHGFRVIHNNGAGSATGFEGRGLNILYIGTGGTNGIGIYTGPAATDKTIIEGSTLQVTGGGAAVEMAGNASNYTKLLGSDVRTGGLTQTGTGFLQVDGATVWASATVLTGKIDLLQGALLTCKETAPACTRMGDEYCDTSAAKCWCDGSAWVKLGGAGDCT